MGWTSYCVGPGKVNRRAEANRIFDPLRCEIVKSTCVGSTVYSAVRGKETGNVSAYVILTRVKDGWFYYKAISEECGPVEVKCPVSILNLLSPTEGRWANEWRVKCRTNAEKKRDPKALANLPVGTRIRWAGHTLVKRDPAYQFKRTWWFCPDNGKYVPRTRIHEYEIIEEA